MICFPPNSRPVYTPASASPQPSPLRGEGADLIHDLVKRLVALLLAAGWGCLCRLSDVAFAQWDLAQEEHREQPQQHDDEPQEEDSGDGR